MLMKVFNKGQVVIPASIRKDLGIDAGDMLDVVVDKRKNCISLIKPAGTKAQALAGSLSKYKGKIRFPTRKEMHNVIAGKMSREKKTY